ncbi:MAG: hypothetical protein LCH77_00660 [Actinobacteria bacterium]|nr:hypothetical protein [Actinomycetota bacterium]
MTHALRPLKLYLANRYYVLGVPLFIYAVVVVLSIAVVAIIGSMTGFPLSEEIREGTRNNAGVLFSAPGFLVSVGVFAATRNFALALALGATRRSFWAGTTLGFALTSLMTATAASVGLGLERLTGHWFIGAHVFDVHVFGDGDLAVLFVGVFVMAIACLAAGALFGTLFRAYGTVRTVLWGAAMGVVALGLLTLAAVNDERVLAWQDAWGEWLSVSVIAAVAAAFLAGSYAAVRRATI